MSAAAWYTVQTSNHAGAGERIPTTAAAASWKTVYDGLIATPEEAREMVNELAGKWAQHARAFKGKNLGQHWYAVLKMPRTERTKLGDQVLIDDTPARAIPTTSLRARRPQRDLGDTALFGAPAGEQSTLF